MKVCTFLICVMLTVLGGIPPAVAHNNELMKIESKCYKKIKALEKRKQAQAFQKCMKIFTKRISLNGENHD